MEIVHHWVIEVSPKVAYQVGILQAKMHSIGPLSGNGLTSIKNEFSNWSNFIESQFASFAEDVSSMIDEALFNKALTTFEKMKNQLPPNDGPSFIHMDFRPANIIIDGDQVSGVIDFESVRFGSTEIDFIKLYRDFLQEKPSYYEAFQDGYKSVRPLVNLESVLPFYSFLDAFNSIGWVKRRGVEGHMQFYEENLARLKKFIK